MAGSICAFPPHSAAAPLHRRTRGAGAGVAMRCSGRGLAVAFAAVWCLLAAGHASARTPLVTIDANGRIIRSGPPAAPDGAVESSHGRSASSGRSGGGSGGGGTHSLPPLAHGGADAFASTPYPITVTDAHVNDFSDWLAFHGVDVASFVLGASHTHRMGVFATADIQSGQHVMNIPAGLAFTKRSVVMARRIGPALASVVTSRLADDLDTEALALVGYLVYAVFYDKQQPLLPWVSLLPRTFPNHPMQYRMAERTLLATCHTCASLLSQQESEASAIIDHLWEHLVKPNIELFGDDLVGIQKPFRRQAVWAYHAYQSRQVPYDGTERAIVPGLDFFNHADDGYAVRRQVDSDGVTRWFTVSAEQFAMADDELFALHLAPDTCNIDILLWYGHVLPDPRHDCVTVTVRPGLVGQFGEVKKQLLVQLGVMGEDDTSFAEVFSTGQPMPMGFLTAMRLTLMEVADFPDYNRAFVGKAISLACELRVVRELYRAVEHLKGRQERRRKEAARRHLVPEDPSKWSQQVRDIMHVMEGEERSLAWLEELVALQWQAVVTSDLDKGTPGVYDEDDEEGEGGGDGEDESVPTHQRLVENGPRQPFG